MSFLTIILFFIYTYGLGFSIAKLAQESGNFLERNLMRIGIGLALMIVLGLLLNLVKVPLDWRIFLALSAIIPLFYLLRNVRNAKLDFKITKYDIAILVMLLIFFAGFYMYAKGAFSYPWLEDDDSWGHAIGVKYVSIEKNVFSEHPLRYMDPYPPGYDMLLGILHQTNNSVYWTLKFFNALVISLSIIFFFFFANEFSGSSRKALFSTFALASIPAFLSHFIWAIALSVPLYFVAFYSIERIRHDKKWVFISAITIGAALTISPTHSAYFALLFVIYYVVKAIAEKSILLHYAAAGFFGAVISFSLWWLPSIIRHGFKGMLNRIGLANVPEILSIHGTGDRIYTLQDFLIAQKTNMINNPIGIGFVISVLSLIALISLLYAYYGDLRKNKLKIVVIFLIISAITLAFLSQTYVKYVQKKGVTALEKGTVPLSELLANQKFFIASLFIMLFVFVSLIVISFASQDFRHGYIIIALAWLIFGFYAVNAGPFYYKISPFRAWLIFAIPLAILASEGLWFLMSSLTKLAMPKFLTVALVIIGILLTSAYQKYTVNTAIWPPGAFWTSNEEIQGYMWLKDNLPSGTRVFTFSNNALIIGLDKFICHWCNDIREFQRNGFNSTAQDTYNWLKSKRYEYLAIDGQAVKKFGIEETNIKVQSLLASGKFLQVHQTQGFILLKAA